MHLSALLQSAVSTDCSIREYQSTYFHGIKPHSLKYPPNMTLDPAYYAFYCAGKFDPGL